MIIEDVNKIHNNSACVLFFEIYLPNLSKFVFMTFRQPDEMKASK